MSRGNRGFMSNYMEHLANIGNPGVPRPVNLYGELFSCNPEGSTNNSLTFHRPDIIHAQSKILCWK